MKFKMEKQGKEFSWGLARQNTIFFAALELLTFILAAAAFNYLGDPELIAWLPYLALFLSAGVVLVFLTQKLDWWWSQVWRINVRRKSLTYVISTMVGISFLMIPAVSTYLLSLTLDDVSYLLFMGLAYVVYLVSGTIGFFISWFLVSIAAKLKESSALANRIHSYFWSEG